eukprot:TRINITY_DN12957_c0_g1_i1.p1 TRINITY_DN12957_c0_g1~~TRINITY_DN12957_c0_g1_i1.p1  ORF type:complete len:454 (-),score=69.86 TRINITY_DN12957_c0_g1_i1:95-1456(-)
MCIRDRYQRRVHGIIIFCKGMTFISWVVFCITCASMVRGVCRDKTNEAAVIDANPIFVKRMDKGAYYQLVSDKEKIPIIVVSGSPYDHGLVVGTFLAKEIKYNMDHLLDGLKNKARKYIHEYAPFIPDFIIEKILDVAAYIFDKLLDVTWILTKRYSHPRYTEEIRGMAKGSALDFMDVAKFTMFPELIKAACSLVGAWKVATLDNHLLFLRALDWSVDSPVTKNPAIVVYKSEEKGSNPYAAFGYAGLIGAFTAVNSKGVAIGEKVWYPNIEDDTETTRAGTPWNYVLRDVVQFNSTLGAAVDFLSNTKRTCSIHIGLAAKQDDSYRAIHYAKNILHVYDDKNFPQKDNPNHPPFENVAYWDKGLQPTKNNCFATLLKEYHRRLTPQIMFQQFASRHETGNCQVCVFDLTAMELYFAFSTYDEKTPINAYDKPMFKVKLPDLFALQQRDFFH